MVLFRWIALIGVAALFVSPLSATIVFSSIQATNLGFTEVAGPFTTARGLAFTPTDNYVFQDAQLKMQATATPNFDLYLYTDSGKSTGHAFGDDWNRYRAVGMHGIVTVNGPAFNLISARRIGW